MKKYLYPIILIIFVAIIGVIFFYKISSKDEITEYKIYSVDEAKEFALNKESNKIIYDILNYDEYKNFCNVYEINDVYEDKNQSYIVACIKAFSMGIEHHNFKILSQENNIYLHDRYTWGATGDKYGLFICIPIENENINFEYINEFEYEDYN